MRTFLIAFTTIVLLAGYAVQPPEKTVPYKVTIRSGESVWESCYKVASNQDNMQELVWRTMKENHINDPGNVQPGTELVIRVKELR